MRITRYWLFIST